MNDASVFWETVTGKGAVMSPNSMLLKYFEYYPLIQLMWYETLRA